jgi:hypothetical protein
MSAVAGSYSRSVVSPWDENVRILAVMFGLLRDVRLRVFCGTAICGVWVPSAHIAPFLSVVNTQQAFSSPTLKNQTDMENHKAGRMTAARRSCNSALLRRRRVKCGPLLFDFRAATLRAFHLTLFMIRKSQNDREFLTAGRT